MIGGEELRLKFDRTKLEADPETLEAIIMYRYAVVMSYARSLKQAYAIEVARQRDRIRAVNPPEPLT